MSTVAQASPLGQATLFDAALQVYLAREERKTAIASNPAPTQQVIRNADQTLLPSEVQPMSPAQILGLTGDQYNLPPLLVPGLLVAGLLAVFLVARK